MEAPGPGVLVVLFAYMNRLSSSPATPQPPMSSAELLLNGCIMLHPSARPRSGELVPGTKWIGACSCSNPWCELVGQMEVAAMKIQTNVPRPNSKSGELELLYLLQRS